MGFTYHLAGPLPLLPKISFAFCGPTGTAHTSPLPGADMFIAAPWPAFMVCHKPYPSMPPGSCNSPSPHDRRQHMSWSVHGPCLDDGGLQEGHRSGCPRPGSGIVRLGSASRLTCIPGELPAASGPACGAQILGDARLVVRCNDEAGWRCPILTARADIGASSLHPGWGRSTSSGGRWFAAPYGFDIAVTRLAFFGSLVFQGAVHPTG